MAQEMGFQASCIGFGVGVQQPEEVLSQPFFTEHRAEGDVQDLTLVEAFEQDRKILVGHTFGRDGPLQTRRDVVARTVLFVVIAGESVHLAEELRVESRSRS